MHHAIMIPQCIATHNYYMINMPESDGVHISSVIANT